MKIALFGGSGKIGGNLIRVLGRFPRRQIVAPPSDEVDVLDLDSVSAFVTRERPDAVINAALFGGVDACERDSRRALAINAFFPRHLARLSTSHDFQLIHFSSDAVFSGVNTGSAYTENVPPDPVNIYGMTKYLADVFIAEEARRYHILRLGMVFGENPKGHQFLEKMLSRALAGEEVRISNDVVTSPTSAVDIAHVVANILDTAPPPGLLHVANAGGATLFDYFKFAADRLGVAATVRGVPSTTFPSLGRQARGVILASKTCHLRRWQDALAEYCQDLRNTLFRKDG